MLSGDWLSNITITFVSYYFWIFSSLMWQSLKVHLGNERERTYARQLFEWSVFRFDSFWIQFRFWLKIAVSIKITNDRCSYFLCNFFDLRPFFISLYSRWVKYDRSHFLLQVAKCLG